MSVHPTDLLLVFWGGPLVCGMRLIAALVGTVIFAGSWHHDDAQHCPVHAFIGGIMSRVIMEVQQVQLKVCVLADVHCPTHVPEDAIILPMLVFLSD